MALAVAAMAHSQAATLKWANSPGTWDVGITTNWFLNFNPATFNNGDSVTFDNGGASAATNIVTIATTVQPASVTVAQAAVPG